MIPNDVLQNSDLSICRCSANHFWRLGKMADCVWVRRFPASGRLNGWILIQGQIPMAAADDHLFLKIFGHRNSKGVPSYGLIITAVLISLLLVLTISPDLVKQYQADYLDRNSGDFDILSLYAGCRNRFIEKGGISLFSKNDHCSCRWPSSIPYGRL